MKLLSLIFLVGVFVTAGANDARIIDGKIANHGEFPFLVSIQLYDGNNTEKGDHFCGGSIIDADTILSAAHCFFGKVRKYIIVAGVSNLKKKPSDSQTRIVSQILISSRYTSESAFLQGNDIALLTLKTPLNLTATKNIKAIPLPKQGNATVAHGDTCQVAGWGAIDKPGMYISNILYKGDVRIVSNAHCSRRWYQTRYNRGQICAGGWTTTNSCRGDSGGPLFCPSNGYFIQVGIVSYGGIPCGKILVPAVYTRVSHYRTWIDTHNKPQTE